MEIIVSFVQWKSSLVFCSMEIIVAEVKKPKWSF